jgi:hypothetical protein
MLGDSLDAVTYSSLALTLGVLSAVPFCLVSFLMAFHIYLKFKGISTYGFIISRQAQRERHKVKNFGDSEVRDKTDLEQGRNLKVPERGKLRAERGASTFWESRSATLNQRKSLLDVGPSEEEVKRNSRSEI